MRRASLFAILVPAAVAGAQDSIPATPPAPLVTGARVRVTTDAGDRHSGRLTHVSDTLLVVDPGFPSLYHFVAGPVHIDRRNVAQLEISSTAQRRTRASLAGTLGGAAVGALIGASSVHKPCNDPDSTIGPCFSRTHGALFGAGLGAISGWIVGRYVFGRDRWEPFTGALPTPPPPPRSPVRSSPPPTS